MSDGRIVIDTEIDNSGAEQGISKLSGIASSVSITILPSDIYSPAFLHKIKKKQALAHY